MSQQTLPNALDLEQAVLGGILLEKKALSVVESDLKPELFYSTKHRFIYEAILSLQKRSIDIDLMTVVEELRRMQALDNAGGVSYIAELAGKVASAANIKTHATIIKEKWGLREIINLSLNIQSHAYDQWDMFDGLKFIQKGLENINQTIASNQLSTTDTLLEGYLTNLNEAYNAYQNNTPVEIGYKYLWSELDKPYPIGLEKGTLTVIGADSGVGKSAFALNLLRVYGGVYFSFEMSERQIMERTMAIASQVNSVEAKLGKLTYEKFVALYNAVPSLNKMYVCDNGYMTIEDIRMQVASIKDPTMVVIDSAQRVQETKGKFGDKAISHVVLGSLKIAKEFNIPVILISSLKQDMERQEGKRAPHMGDLMGSQSLRSDPDNVILMEYKSSWELGEHTYDRINFHFPKTRAARKNYDPSSGDALQLLFDGSIFTFFDDAQISSRNKFESLDNSFTKPPF